MKARLMKRNSSRRIATNLSKTAIAAPDVFRPYWDYEKGATAMYRQYVEDLRRAWGDAHWKTLEAHQRYLVALADIRARTPSLDEAYRAYLVQARAANGHAGVSSFAPQHLQNVYSILSALWYGRRAFPHPMTTRPAAMARRGRR